MKRAGRIGGGEETVPKMLPRADRASILSAVTTDRRDDGDYDAR